MIGEEQVPTVRTITLPRASALYRIPQSEQSRPKLQYAYSEPGPPSSHTPSDACKVVEPVPGHGYDGQ